MKLNEIRIIAESVGVRSKARRKADLIKAIQIAEGNFDCFASASEQQCDQIECCWRDDCFDAAR